MRILLILLYTAFSLMVTQLAEAQRMSIDFPVERTVFQRTISNEGIIYIAGNINRKVDSIQVRLDEYQNNELQTYLDWRNLDNQSVKGYFLDEIAVKGGWFRLRVRAFLNGEIYSESTISKVGVGEVFVISGQSNVQGVPGYSGPLGLGAKDDRVNCVDFYNASFQNGPFFPLAFSHLDDNANIGPMGRTPWIWGEVGDSLVNRLGVPVMFFNSALTGTLSYNWWQSSRGEPTFSAIFRDFFVSGFPYNNLKISLKQYASLLGVRAVLWHQGETDTNPGIPREEEIYEYYKDIITHSRKDFGSNVAWMVSRVSYSGGVFSQQVINAQQRIIGEPGFNIFAGPFTDTLQIPRPDGVHFENTREERGLGLLASAWLRQLNEQFFTTCVPVIEKPIADLQVDCEQGVATRLTIPAGYTLERWNDYNYENQRTVGSGLYTAFLKDENQNYKLSTTVNTGAILFSEPAAPLAEKSYICLGEELLLQADDRFESIRWSDGSTGEQFTAKQGGEYAYNATNGAGCEFRSQVLMLEEPSPPLPLDSFYVKINGVVVRETPGSFTFCGNETIEMSVPSGFESYTWNDGNNKAERQILTEGRFEVQAVYGPGCSTPSRVVLLERISVPAAPVISATGIFELTSAEVFENAELVWYKEGRELAIGKNPFHVTESGTYSARYRVMTTDGTSCVSDESGKVNLEITRNDRIVSYPNPVEDVLYLESRETQSNLTGYITDSRGSKIKQLDNLPIWDRKLGVPVKSLPPGNYILFLKTDKEVYRQKFHVR